MTAAQQRLTEVRPAELADAPAIARVQISSWHASPGIPPDDTAVPDLDEASRLWERAIFLPPSDRHQVWVAAEDGQVVGASAFAPASDPDLNQDEACEITLLTVDPMTRRQGHGSRLLTAVVDAMAKSAVEAVIWVIAQDDESRRYLELAGWAPDGAHRSLTNSDDPTIDQQLRQVRMSTLIGAGSEGKPNP